ncbi:MAG: SGNH/GDSL hydrolase family protein [Bacilli bacterium]|nr:SGNH/GDSL hydrolase family protein [Bacilli bacterium]
MKHKKMIVLVLLILFVSIGVFSIYTGTYEEKFNYVALGDSLASGRNPYGVDDYGYTDYIKDYLNSKGKLNNYDNYAVSGYLVSNIIDDINYNRVLEKEDAVGLKRVLRESDLVTISVGANDLLEGINLSNFATLFSDRDMTINKVDNIIENVENLLVLVKQYAKGDILVIGYYNPFPGLTKYKSQIDDVVMYADNRYNNLCNELDIHYVKISDVIGNNSEFLPNPLDIHPNKQGYAAISKKIIDIIDQEVLK